MTGLAAMTRLRGSIDAANGMPLVACPFGAPVLVRAWAEGWLIAKVSAKPSGAKDLTASPVKHEVAPRRGNADWLPVERVALRLARAMTPTVPPLTLARFLERSERAVKIEASRLGLTHRQEGRGRAPPRVGAATGVKRGDRRAA